MLEASSENSSNKELDNAHLEVKTHLENKWQTNRRKNLLRAHITAIPSSHNLVPSKVLSKQAKLSQCLYSMEIEMQQETLVKTQRIELVELLAEQLARREELHSRNSLKMMNEMCLLENEIKEIQEKMTSRGFSIQESMRKRVRHYWSKQTRHWEAGGGLSRSTSRMRRTYLIRMTRVTCLRGGLFLTR